MNEPQQHEEAIRFDQLHRLVMRFMVPSLVIALSHVSPAVAAPAKPVTRTVTGDGLVPLTVKLPAAKFMGTPKHVPEGTTVEPPSTKKKPPLLVPQGTVNLAKGRPVSLGEAEPIVGDAGLLTDGDAEAGDGTYLELGPGVKTVTVDLGKPSEIWAVQLWLFHGDPRVAHDVVIQTAADADFIKDVQTLFNNDADNSAGAGAGKDREYFETNEGRLTPVNKVKARFVRVTTQGSTADEMNRFTELEVYGRPVK